MSDPGKPTPAEAWQEFKDTFWAAVEPPLIRLTEWITRLLNRLH